MADALERGEGEVAISRSKPEPFGEGAEERERVLRFGVKWKSRAPEKAKERARQALFRAARRTN